MNKAYYCVVKTEEEREKLLKSVKEKYKDDPEYYRTYLDVGVEFDEAMSKRTRYTALRNAMRKGKVDTLILPSFKARHVSELYACNIFLDLKAIGVNVIIEEEKMSFSIGEMSRQEIVDKMTDMYYDFLVETFIVPLITMETCIIYPSMTLPHVYLEKDVEAAEMSRPFLKAEQKYFPSKKECLLDIIENRGKNGFWFYCKEVEGWYHVNEYGVEFLKLNYEENMKILLGL